MLPVLHPWAFPAVDTLNTIWHTLQDTVTGFLLAGVGNVDLRKKSNFLVVTESAPPRAVCTAGPHAHAPTQQPC
jgi:hypothetical protein